MTNHVDWQKEKFEKIELLGKPALLAEWRVPHEQVPPGVSIYDLRHGDDWGVPVSLESRVIVNFFGSVLLSEPISLPGQYGIPLRTIDMNYLDGHCQTLPDFLKENPSEHESVHCKLKASVPKLSTAKRPSQHEAER